MKRFLLFVSVIFVGLILENFVNKSSNEQVVQATVISVEKIKNKRKGAKPFIYKVNVSYENAFGRALESSFIANRKPSFDKGAEIAVSYSTSNPSTVNYQGRKKYDL